MGKRTYIRSGGTWVDVTTGASFPASNAAPSTPQTGQVYFDIDDQKPYIWSGTAWILFASSITDSTSTTSSTVAASATAVKSAYDLAGTKLALADVVGQQTISVPAGAMTLRLTSGAGTGSVETGTNRVMLQSINFDTTTQEFCQFSVQMPKSWNAGTVIAQFIWSHAATTTNFGVAWQIQGLALGDAGAADTAFGTGVVVTDTGGTTNAIYISPETAAVTISNTPAAEKLVVFQVARVPANASDTMAVDARLHYVKIKYTTSAANDN